MLAEAAFRSQGGPDFGRRGAIVVLLIFNRRDQVTATKSWPSFRRKTRAKVDYQVAAATELRTPTMHRAKIAQPRVRMEGWRQKRRGLECKESTGRKEKTKREKHT
jgi:hypothetical protein